MLIIKMFLIHNVLFVNESQAQLLEDGKDTVKERYVLIHKEDYPANGELSAYDVLCLYPTYEEVEAEMNAY